MIFGVEPYLCVPYRPLEGNAVKNDAILTECVEHPERFLVSPRSGDPRVLVARCLTDPDNAVWEVWKSGACVGILVLDRIVWGIDARWQFVFFDSDLSDKAPLLREFARRCFTEAGFHRLTFEVPDHMNVLRNFALKHLGFRYESGGTEHTSRRERAYFDLRWRDLVTLRLFPEDIAYGTL